MPAARTTSAAVCGNPHLYRIPGNPSNARDYPFGISYLLRLDYVVHPGLGYGNRSERVINQGVGDSHYPVGVLRVRKGVSERAASGRAPDSVDRKSTRLNSSHANISYAV